VRKLVYTFVAFIIVIGSLTTFPLHASERSKVDAFGIEPPPVGYDHYPYQYLITLRYEPSEVNELCHVNNIVINVTMFACTYRHLDSIQKTLLSRISLTAHDKKKIETTIVKYPNLCVIILPNIQYQIYLDALKVHEYAHCNGLSHNPGTLRGWYTEDGKQVH
jgi:hypothetical protein